MFIDLFGERGLTEVDSRWGDPDNQCYYPLFDFLRPLPLHWMHLLFMVMLTGVIGIIFGCFYRVSCAMFMIPYWYIFWLDKLSWNNHSYLYGLVSIILLLVDANRAWSVDGYIWPRIRNAHVPAWNYGILRFQLFLVYFIAGLKKTDRDWVSGQSMHHLSAHWVFAPFRLIVSRKLVDLIVVHIGGLIIDLSMGYLLYFDVTRPLGFAIGLSFNLMNSQIFSIGMFPWTMMSTMPLYCAADWPIKLYRKLTPVCLHFKLSPLQSSDHCLYDKNQVKPENTQDVKPDHGDGKKVSSPRTNQHQPILRSRAGKYHKLASVYVIVYALIQSFLPYSHFITKGYNNWTQGLYGYSWDMMVHSWNQQHIRITYKDLDTGKIGYLNPEAWTHSRRSRWNAHADMVKQYAACVKAKLEQYDLKNIELYIDVWKSMNRRFQQRMFDPRVDILTAEWSPFRATPWVLPLLYDLSDWRNQIDGITRDLANNTQYTDVVFVADFPGLMLENYVQDDLNLTTIEVLQGQIRVEILEPAIEDGQSGESVKNVTLNVKDQLDLKPGVFHNVHTISSTPSCYMYKFINRTHEELMQKVDEYEKKLKDATEQGKDIMTVMLNDPNVENYKMILMDRKRSADKKTMYPSKLWRQMKASFLNLITGAYKSVLMTEAALYTVFTGNNMMDVIVESNLTGKVNDVSSSLRRWLIPPIPISLVQQTQT
ncbi:vitamin K-dependent gamma-carboxylase-like isoform X2 [Tubulanus polymorphus]